MAKQTDSVRSDDLAERALRITRSLTILPDWQREGLGDLWERYKKEVLRRTGQKVITPDQVREEFIDGVTGMMMRQFRFYLATQETELDNA